MEEALDIRIRGDGARVVKRDIEDIGSSAQRTGDQVQGLNKHLKNVDPGASLRETSKQFQTLGKDISGVGKSMTQNLTVPILATGVAVAKFAGDFEASLIKVGISTKATTEEMAGLKQAALDIGKNTIFGATEAADAIDSLAKNGLSATQILQGAAKATADLAAAAGSELAPAANAVTDVMNQFGITAGELPGVVNQITGAVNESKLDFADFTGAIAQGGGVAAAAGLSFNEFSTAIAAVSPLFNSGADAGTSFKAFLNGLTPNTVEAAQAFEKLGFSAFDVTGQMKPLTVIAQDLQDKLSVLSQEDRAKFLERAFGSDGIRVAIGLMKQGEAGLNSLQNTINETDASKQAADRMKGFNGQLEQLGGALENLAIKIGESGFLAFLTSVVVGLTNFADALSAVDPGLLSFVAAMAGVVAIAGPIVVGIGAVISAIGVIAPLVVTAAAGFGTLLAAITPIGAVVIALGAVWLIFGKDLQKVLGQALKAVGEFAARMATLGGQAIDGFINGLKSRIGSIVSYARELANTVNVAFKQALQIKSPSKVFEGHGQNVVAGFVAGIQGSQGNALTAARRLATATSEVTADSVRAVFDSLLSEEQRAYLQYQRDVETLRRGATGKNAFINSVELEAGLEALKKKYLETEQVVTKPLKIDFKNDRIDVGGAPIQESAGFQQFDRNAMDGERIAQRIAEDLNLKKVLLEQEIGFYAEIERLRATDVISAQQAEQAKAIFQQRMQAQRLSGFESMLNSFVGLQRSGNSTLAGIGKAAAIAQATIDGVRATQAALANPPGPPFSYAIAAATAAQAASNVASIASTRTTGFETGGSFMVGGSGGPDSQLVSMRASPGERVQVQTPAQVRKGTNAATEGMAGAGGAPQVNQKIVNVLDPAMVGDFLSTEEGEQILINVMRRNSSSVQGIGSL
jgi:TP901 family phage tail tape measure protein